MMKETLIFRKKKHITSILNLKKTHGWEISKPLYKKFNWKKFHFEYILEIEKEDEKSFIEIINNKDEINNMECTFSRYCLNGDLYKKTFFHDKNFDRTVGYHKWLKEIGQSS